MLIKAKLAWLEHLLESDPTRIQACVCTNKQIHVGLQYRGLHILFSLYRPILITAPHTRPILPTFPYHVCTHITDRPLVLQRMSSYVHISRHAELVSTDKIPCNIVRKSLKAVSQRTLGMSMCYVLWCEIGQMPGRNVHLTTQHNFSFFIIIKWAIGQHLQKHT